MFCPECGNDVESTAKFCRHCRHRLTLVTSADLKPEVTRLPVGVDAGLLLPPQPESSWLRPRGQAELPKTREIDLGGGVKLELVLIPAGTFMMGSPESEEGRSDDETQHEVTISKPFYLGKYLVTQAQWQAVMGNNPSEFKGERLPVEMVSWDDAMAFCGKAQQKTGQAFRLPTEAQWEYACRAGTTTPFHFGSELNGTQANCDGYDPYGTTTQGPSLGKTSSVGSYPANGWGLYDMHGNVDEWCSDSYGIWPNYSDLDHEGYQPGIDRVRRGGSWHDYPTECRAASRIWSSPDNGFAWVGFRILKCMDV